MKHYQHKCFKRLHLPLSEDSLLSAIQLQSRPYLEHYIGSVQHYPIKVKLTPPKVLAPAAPPP